LALANAWSESGIMIFSGYHQPLSAAVSVANVPSALWDERILHM